MTNFAIEVKENLFENQSGLHKHYTEIYRETGPGFSVVFFLLSRRKFFLDEKAEILGEPEYIVSSGFNIVPD